MLKNIFRRSADDVMETTRVPADVNQSADYVSYKARRHWHGLWSVHFCDYLPAETAEQRARAQNFKLEGGSVTMPAIRGNGITREFRSVTGRAQKSWLTKDQAAAFLKQKEAGFKALTR